MEFKMIVGLGNPGAEYERTYHNAGALMLDWLLRNAPAARFAEKGAYMIAQDGATLYVRPATFMNDSGPAVHAAMAYYRVPTERLIVLHDDADIALGRFRLRRGGGSGGHHGIASVTRAIGAEDFLRVKIGIRRDAGEGAPREQALDFVLRQIPDEAMETLYGVFAAAEGSLLNVMENEMP